MSGRDAARGAGTTAGGTAPASKTPTSSKTPARKKRGSAGFTPLADAKAAILAFGAAHPALTCAGAALAVIAMGLLLVWFTYFSGYNAPKTFVYAGF